MRYGYIEDDAERKATARREARRLLRRRPWVIDTETTGLSGGAEICEIAVVDSTTGDVLYESYVWPRFGIPTAATRVHGITPNMVADAPTMSDALKRITQLAEATRPRPTLTSFNWSFDSRLIEQSAKHSHAAGSHIRFLAALGPRFADEPDCIMELFSLWYGAWHDYHKSYTWQSLDVAAEQFDIENPRPHRAAGDALTALAVLRAMAEGQS